MAALIEFVCVAPDHAEPGAAGTVTVHQRNWAYCPRGSEGGHEWIRVGGITTDTARKIAFQQGQHIESENMASGPSPD